MNARLLPVLLSLGFSTASLLSVPANLAPGGTATASSYGWGGVPPRANDGNRNGVFGSGSVWHSTCDDVPWLEVDLGAVYYLDHVRLFPRTDMAPYATNIRLRVLDASDNEVWSGDYMQGFTAYGAWATAATRGVQGRKVRLESLGAVGCFALAELEVYGQTTPPPANLAVSKPATASDAGAWGTLIANANDGNLDGDYGHPDNPIFHTGTSVVGQFWQVDLQGSYELGYINIFNRTDSPTTSDVRVSLLDESLAPVYSTVVNISSAVQVLGANQYGVTLNLPAGQVGRYVRVETTLNEFLALGEVEVFELISDATPPVVTAPPVFESIGGLFARISYSEPVDPVTATNPAHYTFEAPAEVTGATLLPGGSAVLLSINGLLPFSTYSLAIAGVQDLAGNTIVTTNFSGAIGFYEINWARVGTASASSDAWGGVPARANDGGIDGDWNRGSVYHSADSDLAPWWQVDLGGEKPIGQVRVWLRTDCCWERNSDLQVVVLDGSGAEVSRVLYPGNPFYQTPANNMFFFNYAPGLSGRYVRIEYTVVPPNNLNLMLAEVEVIAPYQNMSIAVVSDPLDQTVEEFHKATFGPVEAMAFGAPTNWLTLEWQVNGRAIPGADAPTYSTPGLSQANNGDVYTAVFRLPGLEAASARAFVWVVPDVTPPQVESVTPIIDTNGETRLLVRFDELINPDNLKEFWYYSLMNGLTLESVQANPDGRSATLTVSGLVDQFGFYSLDVAGLTDLAGNFLAEAVFTGRWPWLGNNFALTGAASMSTTGIWGNGTVTITASAGLAIDGNSDGDFWDGSVCHNADGDTERWWEVDLGADRLIGGVRIWWRTDGYDYIKYRNTNATVRVLDAARNVVWSRTYPGLPPIPSTDFVPPSGVVGRIVRFEPAPVSETGTELFNFAELQVFEALQPLLLSIQRTETGVTLSWPASVQGFVLEGSDDIASDSWTPVDGVVNNSVTLSASEARWFYRLKM